LALRGEDGKFVIAATAPIGELRLTQTSHPTPWTSLIIDFGGSQWLVDFSWADVIAASTNQEGQVVKWRVGWNSKRPRLRWRGGARKLCETFTDLMVDHGATLVR
jgi:hypothetical protein